MAISQKVWLHSTLYTLYVILTVTPPVIFTVMSHNMMVDALLHYMREDALLHNMREDALLHNMREDALLHNMMVDALLHAEDFAEDFYGRVVDVCKPSGG